jgi:hypothetical protein
MPAIFKPAISHSNELEAYATNEVSTSIILVEKKTINIFIKKREISYFTCQMMGD